MGFEFSVLTLLLISELFCL